MTPERAPRWTFLGSSLWLRPPGSQDRPRLEAFLERSDLVQSPGAVGALRARLETDAGWPSRFDPRTGIVLAAFDALGAPAVLLALVPGPEADEVSLSLIASRNAAPLRETVRLVCDAVAERTGVRRLVLGLGVATPDLRETLEGAGWEARASDVWIRHLRPELARRPEARHAG